ncbi:MAG: site-2 protease family protein [Clostridia bacterium]|nr:site-2 protease family protein [Clostridia bacterium]
MFDIVDIILSILCFVLAISFHEWAHAYAAYRLGDNTAFYAGRMTLNPLAHLDIKGLLFMIIFRFGWAKPVPVNPRNFKNLRRDDIIVSSAGILTNILLAFLLTPIYLVLLTSYTKSMNSEVLYYLSNFVVNFIIVNISLAVFNLIPLPPLDGFHLLEDFLIKTVGPKPFLFMRKYALIFLIVIFVVLRFTNVLGIITGDIFSAFLSLFGSVMGV